MNLQILPLALTMMMGPQELSAIVFVTTPRAVKVSLAYIAGVALAATAGTAITTFVISALGANIVGSDSSSDTSTGTVIQVVFVGLLIAFAIKSYVTRKTSKPPKILASLMDASPAKAFKTALLLIFLMPTDIIVMITVGANMADNDLPFTAAIPFLLLTVFIAALPLLSYLVFGKKARTAMPNVRDWMNSNSWVVNIIVCVIFLAMILG